MGLKNVSYSEDFKDLRLKRAQFKVLFSNCQVPEADKEAIKKMGARLVENVTDDFNVLVMDSFKRRIKLLAALNKRAAIVSPDWIYDCIIEKRLLEPEFFTLKVGPETQN